MKLAFSGIAIVMMLLPATGCTENAGAGPNSISQSEGRLLIAVCEEIDVRTITGSAYSEDGRQAFMDLSGSALLPRGTILEPGIAGLEGTFDSVRTAGVNSLDIHFEGTGKGSSWQAVFGSEGNLEIPEDGWLHTDGTVSDEACPSLE